METATLAQRGAIDGDGTDIQAQGGRYQSPPPAENYVSGFDGMAVAPFDEKIRAVLRAAVNAEEVEIKPDGIVYLPGVFYRQILTRAFGEGGWAIAPRSPAKRAPASGGELVMYHGALWCLGRYVSEAVGQCVYYPNNAGMTYADAFEGAKTDAITRCCKDLGIARELWDPGWREQWQAKYARQVSKRAQIWNPDTKKKEWGEKKVWERISRGQKLGVATAAAASGVSGPGAAAKPAAAAPSSQEPDSGEAPADEELANLVGLIRELKWKRQWTVTWFKGRFGVEHTALTKEQLRTAFKLLYAFARGQDAYTAALKEEAAAGRCQP